MLFPFWRCWCILATGHQVLAQVIVDTNATNATEPVLATNITTSRLLLQYYGTDDATISGRYQILLCGAGQTDSKAAKLQALLPLIWQNLQVAIQDVKKGTTSQHGYTAFFKTDTNQAAVTDLFHKISAGDPVPVSADRATRLGSPTASPTFACMEEGDAFTAHLYAECLARNTGTISATLMTWGATEIVFICPSFWALPAGLTRASCPRVVRNRASPDDEALIRSMYGSVVHMLAHVYVPESLDYGNSVVQEVDGVQAAIELNATESLVTASNYAFYAAGE
ncbi:hypothetical protein HO173_004385 [Letharia columbiana]|uniref:Uncharacterized protein n=1 Tax=Letharia columbiana TaxID=112416 RepID=A0A8H6FZF8_9LECA|nr:uncharacterized protein HO173_004385 [Letharia columbiana]KAF6237495.1 hypothetical protein HO173_004385 [Letharia columbiana]